MKEDTVFSSKAQCLFTHIHTVDALPEAFS